jgi:hypothetical protein
VKTLSTQFQRTVIRHRGAAASAPFHHALAVRFGRQRAAAERGVVRPKECLPC